MSQTAYKILRPGAIEHIKSITELGYEQTLTPSTDSKNQIDDDTPITASYIRDSYQSFYKDDIWKISESLQLNFKSGVEGLNSEDILELKTLSYLFLEIPFARAKGLYKSLLSPMSVQIRTATLKALKKTNTLKNRPLISLFTDLAVADELSKELRLAEINKAPLSSIIFANLRGVISHVSYLSRQYIDIEPIFSVSLDRTLEGAYNRARAQSEQHTIIPPIIYCKIYTDAIDVINAWDSNKFEKDSQRLISAYTDLSDTGSNNGKPAGISRRGYQGRLSAFLEPKEKVYQRRWTYKYFKNKIKSVGQVDPNSFFFGSRNITDVTFEIRRIQAFLARLIMQETSMREDELILLLNEPIKIITTTKGTVFLIIGKETKISGGKRSCWVVSKNGKAAHDILRQLSDFSYKIQIVDPSFPKWLFPQSNCGLTDKNSNNIAGKWTAPDGRTAFRVIVDDKPITVDSLIKYKDLNDNWADRTGDYYLSIAEVNFLHRYSTAKNCLNDNVLPDQVFPLTEHQFRRSLAFYGSASDLLSIADLKYQTKHVTSITTYFYANGGKALLLSGLILDEDTYTQLNDYIIANTEHTDTILRKELISILDDSAHTLFGPGLVAVKKFTENINYSTNPDKEWSDLAKEGSIKTKKLPHGWCITTQPCDDFANNNFDQCFNCANGVLDLDKSIALIAEAKNQAKKAKNDFNKRSFTLLAERIESAATDMYPGLFENKL